MNYPLKPGKIDISEIDIDIYVYHNEWEIQEVIDRLKIEPQDPIRDRTIELYEDQKRNLPTKISVKTIYNE